MGTLAVIHDPPGMEPYSSDASLVSGEIGDDLTYNFAASDQVPTWSGVGALVDRLEKSLSSVCSVTDLLEEGMTPTDILECVLEGLSYKELDAMPAEFHCICNRERATRLVLALGRSEQEGTILKGEPADVYCRF